MTTIQGDSVFTGKKAVIFDFDGTIADTLPLHDQAFQEALAGYPLRFRYHDYAGMSTKNAIALIFEANQQSLEEAELAALTKKKQYCANALYRQSIRFMPGAEALIQLLHQKNFKLFVASSGSHMNVAAGLEALGIAPFFSGVVTANDVTHAKPHPEIFLTTLAQFQIPAAEAIVIEDALSGLQAAAAAGIDAVCIDEQIVVPHNGQTFVLASMIELKAQLINEPQRS